MGLFSSKCTASTRLDGKTVVITGANTGIGKSTAQDFYTRGARVVMACRNLGKAKRAVEELQKACKSKPNLGTLLITKLDLSSLKSVKECAAHILETEKSIHLLINNAGVTMWALARTEDGFEMQMGVNHLGHFLFTMLLLPRIYSSAPARIVNVSSDVYMFGGRIDLEDLNWHKRRYCFLLAYQQSKLANILFTKELSTKLKEHDIKDVTVYSLHPGIVNTNLADHVLGEYRISNWLHHRLSKWLMKTADQGAQTTIYCAVDEKCATENGLYYYECAPRTLLWNARNMEDARALWQASLKLVQLPQDYDPFTKEYV
ncbi:hypothetical protein NQ315_000294 [Exocentrus adspersus]|uniref:Retinol dehydrogenase 11 n=1 Tax=Exocentrus adspersus TaxID=1586481 RepID=A0AAV8VRL7_9CUCU|nr:hypothetical protein NQ315_000294 [Exocentrus adspersus]